MERREKNITTVIPKIIVSENRKRVFSLIDIIFLLITWDSKKLNLFKFLYTTTKILSHTPDAKAYLFLTRINVVFINIFYFFDSITITSNSGRLSLDVCIFHVNRR